MYRDFDVSSVFMHDSGVDDFFGEGDSLDAELSALYGESAGADLPNTFRVANVKALGGFRRIASDTLVRKSEKDLWSLRQTEDGEWVVERLFDDEGKPLTM